MKNISVKLNLLFFSLQKKIEKLEAIKECTLAQSQETSVPALTELIHQKQDLIEEIEKLDQGFQSVSREIMPILQADVMQYSELIQQMQEQIKRISEVSLEIQELEKKNYNSKMLRENRPELTKEGVRLPKGKALDQYRKMK